MSVYLIVDVLDWMAHGIIIFGAFVVWLGFVIAVTPRANYPSIGADGQTRSRAIQKRPSLPQ